MRYAILIVIGLVLAIAVAMVLQPKKPAEDATADGEKVLMAKVDLQPGSFIVVASHIDFVAMNERDIKPNYLQKKNVNLAEINGAVVRNLIKAGEPVEKEKIVTPKEGGFLSAVLYPGTRAISVGVDVVSGNAGFIFPGDKVDLLLTHQVDTSEGKKSYATETFVENVRVLAIDQQVNNPENIALVPKTVTLEVTPKQAEKVLVAVELGKISLVLRSSGNNTVNDGRTEIQTFTRDNEVSKLIGQTRPDKNIEVTITRGKTTTETKVGSEKPQPNIIVPQESNQTSPPGTGVSQ